MRLDIVVPSWARAIVSDLTDMHRSPHPVDASTIRRFSIELPDDVYFEYAFLDDGGRVRADPAREERGENPWYPAVSAVRGPDHAHHPLSDPPPSARPGEATRYRIDSAAWGAPRRVIVHTPAGASGPASGPLPLTLFHDGVAFLRVARTPDLFDALRAAGEVDDALLVFVEPDDREREYAFDERHARFVLDELLPFVRERHDVSDETIVAGVSLGALAAAQVALASDGAVATVLTQSGAFLGSPDDPRFHGVDHAWLPGELARRDLRGLRWASEVGTIEWLTDVNREVHEVLEVRAGEHRYAERAAGHNWRSWRDGLPDLLRFALRQDRALRAGPHETPR
ncbi:MAG: esterase family protein [Trueperaceae bacterium]|nr:esterase family protein [Trueperaceae bacterium]